MFKFQFSQGVLAAYPVFFFFTLVHTIDMTILSSLLSLYSLHSSVRMTRAAVYMIVIPMRYICDKCIMIVGDLLFLPSYIYIYEFMPGPRPRAQLYNLLFE